MFEISAKQTDRQNHNYVGNTNCSCDEMTWVDVLTKTCNS